MFGNQKRGSSSEKKRKTPSKHGFQEEWEIRYPWVYIISVAKENTSMKCKFYNKHNVEGPWGIGTGCNTIQYDDVATLFKVFYPSNISVEKIV
jgi:hypothetical protein